MELLGILLDKEFDYKKIRETRIIARAFLFNSDGQLCFHHLYGDDHFGHRDYLETPGGGVDEDEDLIEGLKREIEEETGYKIEVIKEVGLVVDYYNLIDKENYNYFYVARIIGKGEKKETEFEKRMIKETVWLTIDEAIKAYENFKDTHVGNIVKKRELPLLKLLKSFDTHF